MGGSTPKIELRSRLCRVRAAHWADLSFFHDRDPVDGGRARTGNLRKRSETGLAWRARRQIMVCIGSTSVKRHVVVLVAVLAAIGVAVGLSVSFTSGGTLSALPSGPLYPAPLAFAAGDSHPGCPNSAGVVTGVRPTVRELVAAIERLGRSKSAARRITDPSDWNQIGQLVEGFRSVPNPKLLASRILIWPETERREIAGLEIMRYRGCPKAIWRATWVAEICPGPYSEPATETCHRDPALAGDVYFIDRLGHWLATWNYP